MSPSIRAMPSTLEYTTDRLAKVTPEMIAVPRSPARCSPPPSLGASEIPTDCANCSDSLSAALELRPARFSAMSLPRR